MIWTQYPARIQKQLRDFPTREITKSTEIWNPVPLAWQAAGYHHGNVVGQILPFNIVKCKQTADDRKSVTFSLHPNWFLMSSFTLILQENVGCFVLELGDTKSFCHIIPLIANQSHCHAHAYALNQTKIWLKYSNATLDGGIRCGGNHSVMIRSYILEDCSS